jgi:BlaI family transcriptional regulator, penicillinase repressor
MSKSRSKPLQPTSGELEILQVLWDAGPITVREVYETLSKRKPIVYTTVLKLMQIMTDKGLVKRDEAQRAHVYSAQVEREDTQQQVVRDLLNRLFQGSAKQLVMQALAAGKTSREERDEIRRLLDQISRGAK